MPDTHSVEQRRKNMQAIKSQSKLENKFSRALWNKGYRFRKNDSNLYGKPDISIKKYKIVIFIDSCFWHSCALHGNRPKSNQEYWDKKLKRNVERDIDVSNYYKVNNWNILRIWEHELKKDFNKTVENVVAYIEKIKQLK
ncbi:very short patch repair endonuclease [Fictibacillus enclensis]|uniref:very short patch repair endonuclease n=1 Tax=Fictibacillus enclensis TaxID=1017270 RepID=UPI0025A0D9A8|nr:very short patch repair endonuclease [Fictibacillus enclensis]MDM5337373.1 very short patch repair endonuclease [Fictibacillus enclensis]